MMSLGIGFVEFVKPLNANARTRTSKGSGFEVGTRNLVEVLLAQRSLYQARRDYSNALYDYIIQMTRLRESAGMLTPADVERIDDFLKDGTMVRRSDYGL